MCSVVPSMYVHSIFFHKRRRAMKSEQYMNPAWTQMTTSTSREGDINCQTTAQLWMLLKIINLYSFPQNALCLFHMVPLKQFWQELFSAISCLSNLGHRKIWLIKEFVTLAPPGLLLDAKWSRTDGSGSLAMRWRK